MQVGFCCFLKLSGAYQNFHSIFAGESGKFAKYLTMYADFHPDASSGLRLMCRKRINPPLPFPFSFHYCSCLPVLQTCASEGIFLFSRPKDADWL